MNKYNKINGVIKYVYMHRTPTIKPGITCDKDAELIVRECFKGEKLPKKCYDVLLYASDRFDEFAEYVTTNYPEKEFGERFGSWK